MRKVTTLLAVLASVVAVLVVPQAASAAPAAPTIVAPTAGAETTANPVLTWKVVFGATKYDVDVSASADFATKAWSVTTANVNAVPTNDLGLGTYYWRVRAYDVTGVAGAYATGTFTKVATGQPVLVSPNDGAVLSYPVDRIYYEWQPVAGVKQYQIQIDDDAAFVGAPAPVNTPNTFYAPLSPPVFGASVFWRVRSMSSSGVYSQWTPASSFSVGWDPSVAMTLVNPPSTNAVPIEKVVLAWQPVPGSAYYQLDLSPDQNFNNPIYNKQVVDGTTFIPMDNLPAGAYYWRVRPMSTSTVAEPGVWSQTWTFTKAWPASDPQSARPNGTEDNRLAQVQLLTPADGDFGLDQAILTWAPQRTAAHYEVQTGPDVNFSPGTYGSCATEHTSVGLLTESPTILNFGCSFNTAPGAVTYWRVRAVDVYPFPLNPVYGAWSSVRSFMYDPVHLVQNTPADGATVDVPVLTWNPVANISRFKVSLTYAGSNATTCPGTVTDTVWGTTYVPEVLKDGCAGPWKWTVQGIEDGSGTRLTRLVSFGSWPSFTVATPTPGPSLDPVTTTPLKPWQPPLLTWQAVTTATKYQVFASVSGANSYLALGGQTNQLGYAYSGEGGGYSKLLPPGDYDYFVEAFNGTTPVAASMLGSFHIAALPQATLTGPADCPPDTCTAVEWDTPTFSWDSVDGAGYYMVYTATDPLFTNITHTYTTPFTSLRPRDSLPDSQAGQATYWFVRPCLTAGACGPFDASVFPQARAFRKQTRPVAGLTASTLTGMDATGTPDNAVLFAWQDYLVTNTSANPTTNLEASTYNLQVSTTPNFTNIVDNVVGIDQTTYVAATKTYPEGPLYARVQAVDRTGNLLTFSSVLTFEKLTPKPSGLQPTGGTSLAGTPLLQWDAVAGAKEYDVEVYKNPDSAISPTNLVATVKTRLTTAAILNKLAANTTYGWRVRRTDSGGNPGRWTAETNTDLARFTVTGPAPTLIAPVDGSAVNGSDVLLTWGASPGATRYRVDASTSSTFATLLQSSTTDATAFAPTLTAPVWPNTRIYWRVVALDLNGAPTGTSATWSLTRDASTAGEVTAVRPWRVFDTRTLGPLTAGATRSAKVSGGSTGIPASGLAAVVVDLTLTGATAATSVTVWPVGAARPSAPTLSVVPGQTISLHTTVPVTSTGSLYVYNPTGSVHAIIDTEGYVSNGTLPRMQRYTAPAAPTRIYNTLGGSGIPATPFGASQTRLVQVRGKGGVPSTATGVVLNVTAYAPTTNGVLSVYPMGSTRTSATSVSFTTRRTVSNLVTVPLASTGGVNVFNSAGTTHVLVDVVGWYTLGDPAAGTRLHPVAAARVADTRTTDAPKIAAGTTRTFTVRGKGGVPNSTGVKEVVLRVTALKPLASGYVTVWTGGLPRPGVASQYFVTGLTTSNEVVVRIPAGTVNVFSSAATDVLVDVVGWTS